MLEVSNTFHRSGIIHKRTVRSSGGFRSTKDIGGGLILLMRLQSGIITVSMGHLIWNTFETPNEAFIGKMRCENTRGMFIKWSEREVSL
jgi:hypothetical protein